MRPDHMFFYPETSTHRHPSTYIGALFFIKSTALRDIPRLHPLISISGLAPCDQEEHRHLQTDCSLFPSEVHPANVAM
jgi:hypothetical protein